MVRVLEKCGRMSARSAGIATCSPRIVPVDPPNRRPIMSPARPYAVTDWRQVGPWQQRRNHGAAWCDSRIPPPYILWSQCCSSCRAGWVEVLQMSRFGFRPRPSSRRYRRQARNLCAGRHGVCVMIRARQLAAECSVGSCRRSVTIANKVRNVVLTRPKRLHRLGFVIVTVVL